LPGKSVSFTLTLDETTTTLGVATTDSSGIATLTDIDLSGIDSGVYAGAVTAAFAGDPGDMSSSDSGNLTVSQATPTITWANPADITAGTALSATQFDATASVPGTLTYTPAAGMTLSAGSNQTLTVNFTPSDAIDYTTATATAKINVTSSPTPTPTPATTPTTTPTPTPTPTSTPSPTRTPVPPVVVLGVHWQTRKLPKHKTAKVLVVSYSGALDQASAQDPNAYHLVAAGRDRMFGTRDDKTVILTAPLYDPTANTVTLNPKGTVPAQALQLTIPAALELDSEGRPIDGNRDGLPGGDFQASIKGSRINLPAVSAAAFEQRFRVKPQTLREPPNSRSGLVSAAKSFIIERRP
jgi:hypothetical protein